MTKEKDLVSLLMELNQVNRKLDRIKNDPDYIEEKTREVFKNHQKRDYAKELNAIINNYL